MRMEMLIGQLFLNLILCIYIEKNHRSAYQKRNLSIYLIISIKTNKKYNKGDFNDR